MKYAIDARQPETEQFWRKEIALQDRLTDGGVFWADAVAQLKREKRFIEAAVVCRRALPVPAAFSHLLICLRKIYVKGADNKELLQVLYSHAVEQDVLYRVPYLEVESPSGLVRVPGFNVSSILFDWIRKKEIEFPYRSIGYSHVQTLIASDRARLESEFGSPDRHQDPFIFAKPLWDKASAECIRREQARNEESRAELRKLFHLDRPAHS